LIVESSRSANVVILLNCVAHWSSGSAYQEAMKQLLRQLPEHNYQTLKYLISLLVLVTQNERANKMNAPAIGIVFGPNLLRWLFECLTLFCCSF